MGESWDSVEEMGASYVAIVISCTSQNFIVTHYSNYIHTKHTSMDTKHFCVYYIWTCWVVTCMQWYGRYVWRDQLLVHGRGQLSVYQQSSF